MALKLTWGVSLLLALTSIGWACGSSVRPVDGGTGVDADAAKTNTDDAGVDAPFAAPSQAALVLVDDILDATLSLTNGSTGAFQDVRVCVFVNNVALTQYAIPDDQVMPFTNYVGVSHGRGIDLGSLPGGIGNATIDVFNAGDLSSDAAWAASRTGYDCASMTCDKASAPCRVHAQFPVTLTDGVNVLALVDDTASGHVKTVVTGYDDHAFAGAEGDLWGTVVNFSGWHDGNPVGAFYGNWINGSGVTDVALAGTLTPNVAGPPNEITTLSGDYETLGVRFDETDNGQQPFDRFGQSLDSIAFVSNPNVDPITFYGVRKNFVFALIGDPSDPTSVLADNGRNYKFDGIGLHIIAIPYATPLPLN